MIGRGRSVIAPLVAAWVAAAGVSASAQVVEVVPTSRRQPASWRYTLERPAEGWTAASFDDSAWQTGAGGFGTAGTPSIVVNTRRRRRRRGGRPVRRMESHSLHPV